MLKPPAYAFEVFEPIGEANINIAGITGFIELQDIKKGQFIFIQIGEDAADEIRDWVMDKQAQIGFDINYELTPEGKILEELIDAFYIG